ncbi:ABC transporter substrate-binding protein [Rhizobium johnstonii]|uniref:ABC transporter substrate-binding protein n=1 Tax=Rhizobium TaxID=379 RepID=UPI003F9B7CB3
MKLTRRQFVGTSATFAASLALPLNARAQDTQTLRLGMGAAQVGTIDPIKLTQGVDNWALNHVFDQLVRPPAGLGTAAPEAYVPEIAETWEMSKDAKTWTFHLRKGVQFHKGYGELTSEDVKFSFDRAANPKAGSVNSISWQNVQSVEAPDPYTVVLKLAGPDPLLLTSVVHGTNAAIVSRKAVEEKGDRFAMDPVGSGPYQLDSVQSDLVRLVANTDYWGEKAKIPNMEISYIVDTSARTFAILGGTVDMILAPAGPGAINSIMQQNPNLKMDISLPGNNCSLHFNMGREPFGDERVRKAFAYAIDKQAISNSLTPVTPRTFGLNPPANPGALTEKNIPAELRYDHNPEKAKALLAEAGFAKGLSFSAFCSQRDDYASLMLIIQEQLRQVGVNMDLKFMDHTSYHAEKNKDLNTLILRLGGYPQVPTRVIQNEAISAAEVKKDGSGGDNFSHYGVIIPGIDDLYNKATNEPDLNRRLELVTEMERKILTDMPVMSLCSTAYVVIRNPNMTLPFTVSTVAGGTWRLTGAEKLA